MTVITGGSLLSEDARARALENLKARAELAEHNGLPHTAQSWREMVSAILRACSSA